MRRDWLTLAFGLLLVTVVVALSLRENIMHPGSRPPAPSEAAPPPASAAAPRPASESETPAAGTAPSATPPPPKAAARANTPTPAPVPTNQATLIVASDVQGASVFLDRQFVGTTPLTVTNLEPGKKQLNVTATGHEGYAEGIELTAGPNRINVEFLKVRLDASVPVVHRHGMGSCQGTLAASVNGVSYQTENEDDAFSLPLAEVDEFDMDYLKKNLKVRRRGGRTWNFTSPNGDALFVFHRDVQKARERLAAAR
jgi:hypothetical protein